MIERRNNGRGHRYVDTETGNTVPGVTTIASKGIPKGRALENWLVNVTVDYALDHWDELAALAPSERVKRLQKARFDNNGAAKTRGTQVHRLAEGLIAGRAVRVPDGLEGYVEGYLAFLRDFEVEPMQLDDGSQLVERTVWSQQHNYCGTLDLGAELLHPDEDARVNMLLDLKTTRSGIFGETAWQLAGYRYADYLIGNDGSLIDMPKFDAAGAVHLRPDGTYSLVPLSVTETEHRTLLYARQIADAVDMASDLVGDPLVPPTTTRYRLTPDPDEMSDDPDA